MLGRNVGWERERERIEFDAAEGSDGCAGLGTFSIGAAALGGGEDAADSEQGEGVLDEDVE